MTKASKNANNTIDKVSCKQRIFSLITSSDMTYKELKEATNFNQATVTARLSELLDLGLITERTINNDVTVFCRVWATELQEQLRVKRRLERSQRLVNAVLNDEVALNMLMSRYVEAIKDCRQAMIDYGMNENSIQILSMNTLIK
jgi:predicted transcriptional regulator